MARRLIAPRAREDGATACISASAIPIPLRFALLHYHRRRSSLILLMSPAMPASRRYAFSVAMSAFHFRDALICRHAILSPAQHSAFDFRAAHGRRRHARLHFASLKMRKFRHNTIVLFIYE